MLLEKDYRKADAKKVSEWIRVFSDPGIDNDLKKIYGDNPELLSERKTAFLQTLSEFNRVYYGDKKVILIRVPGRANLMGKHIEHRGGYVNYFCIQREIIAVASPLEDDRVMLHNINSKFSQRTFSIGEEIPEDKRGNWLDYINKANVSKGDWGNYIKAILLAFQNRYPHKKLRGMQMLINGNIPVAAGLSSSSALVVAGAIATIAFNNLKISKEELAEFCGEAEWYVGTRGGAGDHAAMIFGKRGFITHLRFFPFTLNLAPLPAGYEVVICNSLKRALKSKEVRNTFNERIFTYEIALMLIKKNFPQFSDELIHLRDVNTENLKVKEDFIYQILKSLPCTITRKEILQELPLEKKRLNSSFQTHQAPFDGYKVRDVCLFGLSEASRGEIFSHFLKKGDIQKLGRLMYISHDGDRVFKFDDKGEKCFWNNGTPDDYLNKLIRNLESDDFQKREKAKIYMQSGGYRCSTEELDELIDIAEKVKGVMGACLTGAGLGGCILVLIRKENVEDLLKNMKEKYYQPRGLPLAAEVCISTEGAGVLV